MDQGALLRHAWQQRQKNKDFARKWQSPCSGKDERLERVQNKMRHANGKAVEHSFLHVISSKQDNDGETKARTKDRPLLDPSAIAIPESWRNGVMWDVQSREGEK